MDKKILEYHKAFLTVGGLRKGPLLVCGYKVAFPSCHSSATDLLFDPGKSLNL